MHPLQIINPLKFTPLRLDSHIVIFSTGSGISMHSFASTIIGLVCTVCNSSCYLLLLCTMNGKFILYRFRYFLFLFISAFFLSSTKVLSISMFMALISSPLSSQYTSYTPQKVPFFLLLLFCVLPVTNTRSSTSRISKGSHSI